MHLNDKSKTAEVVVGILRDEGFRVERNFKLGERDYADIVGLRDIDNKMIVVEIKPDHLVLDQSDIMQVMAYIGSLSTQRNFAEKEVLACIISPAGGTLSANRMANEFGVHLVVEDKEEKLRKDIRDCVSASPLKGIRG